jgi:GNAT superfamily N-acetyltransferase
VELRPTTDGDLAAMHAVYTAALDSVFKPHDFDGPASPLDVFTNVQRHVVRTGRSFVAEDDGELVAFGSSWQRGDDWFLASLFVAPRAQGRGVGSALLDAVWGDASRRRTMTDAVQPISNALYGRRGLIPSTPVLTFTGPPNASSTLVEAPADLAAIDAAAYGFDRAVDHAEWDAHARRSTWGEAYAYVFPGGSIGPVAGLDGDAAARALEAELARADGDVRVRIPGTSRALVAAALGAGLELGPTPGLLLLSDGVSAPTALAVSGYPLF